MLFVTYSNPRQQQELEHAAGPLEFGRIAHRGAQRVVLDDPHVSRDQLRIRERSNGLLEIENLSRQVPVYLADGTSIAPGGKLEAPLPLRLNVGLTVIDVALGGGEVMPDSWQTVYQPVRSIAATRPNLTLAGIAESITPQTLAQWFETVIAVQHSAAGSAEFYQETARAVVDLVGLDRAMVLLRAEGEADWQVAASHSTASGSHADFSRTILRRLVAERQTFYRAAEPHSDAGSLLGVEAVVVSPIFGPNGEVAGALYGLRTASSGTRRAGIHPLEAQVVQLLAAAVGSGLARVKREAEATRLRVQFEQFFTPELARELQRDPALLEGRDRTVTILFSDIRGFSGLSERLGPVDTFRLVGDVMERLSARIEEHGGTLVNYIGDGLMAMWNAPGDQHDHAARACRAALAIVDELPALTERWKQQVGAPLGVGIGLNTGVARVGNTGSSRRFYYAPLGHAVNVASRVEGATKYLGVPILISGPCRQMIDGEFQTRRLCRARLPGLASAIDLYELHPTTTDPRWLEHCSQYEQSLASYESGQWDEACRGFYRLLSESQGQHYDIPSLILVGRSVECLKSPPDDFDPVLELAHK